MDGAMNYRDRQTHISRILLAGTICVEPEAWGKDGSYCLSVKESH
jgi:hypothetical protein